MIETLYHKIKVFWVIQSYRVDTFRVVNTAVG